MDSDSTNTNADGVLAQAAAWLDGGRRVALATVVRTWGSAPRRAGSHMAIAADGAFAGSVSGGCIEGAVIEAALEAIESGESVALEFGVTNEMAWEVGLACGGEVRVFVEPVRGDVLREVVAAQRAGRDAALATRLSDGAQALIAPGSPPPLGLPGDAVAAALRSGQARTVEAPGGAVFVRPYIRAPRLIVVGAVHIAQALAPMAAVAGFRVVVVDPRRGFATHDRFPDAEMVDEWPDEAMARLRPDARTGVAALTHDPRIDDPALVAALKSEAFYIGALGSRKTQAARRERLAAAGFAAADLNRVRGPIGLPIGAQTPEEIAVAVLAEVIAALRGSPRQLGSG